MLTGARLTGGNLNQEDLTKVNALLEEFETIITEEVTRRQLRRAVVRAMLPCNLFVILDQELLHVGAEKASGMPTVTYLDHKASRFSLQQVYEAARWEFGYENPFVFSIAASLLQSDPASRRPALMQIATQCVESEVRRVHKEMNIITINPVFGPASYEIDPRLAFVLMPYDPELTEIYTTLIKPTVEGAGLDLVCRRADDIKSNRAVMQDIWKSICEARLIIADLTGLNPNVMYELGVAHTLGKETLLIYRRDSQIKFPFDLAHIRRIEYDNSPVGGADLQTQLRDTLSSLLRPGKIGPT